MRQVEDMLGVSFHYYVEVQLPAFRNIVDAVGGVYFDVPRRLYYVDPDQDLVIDVPAGYRRLNGTLAEGLIRYREYGNADLGRNAVQMEFMKQLIRQSMTKEAIMREPMTIINFVLKDIRHNVGVDAIRYLPYVLEMKNNDIRSYTMPGNSQYIGGASYFVSDNKALADTVHDVFYANQNKPIIESIPEKPSHGLKIQVLNGSRIAGLGSEFADRLVSEGYTVLDTGINTGANENTSRILVREEGMGEDLIPYFNNVVINSNHSIQQEYDIVIVLGRGES
jgi:anionic cell wall polymer biosynthesis LytR-Cps2A-Psr (LCP) family protein